MLNHKTCPAVVSQRIGGAFKAFFVRNLAEGRTLGLELISAGPLALVRCGAFFAYICIVGGQRVQTFNHCNVVINNRLSNPTVVIRFDRRVSEDTNAVSSRLVIGIPTELRTVYTY